jgi:hypothetical protein
MPTQIRDRKTFMLKFKQSKDETEQLKLKRLVKEQQKRIDALEKLIGGIRG